MASIELPPPAELARRWGVMARVCATLGFPDWTIDAAGAHRSNPDGTWALLVVLADGRASLAGFDRVASTTALDSSFDPLAAAPDWATGETLSTRIAERPLGYALWYDGGWSRGAVADGRDDGAVRSFANLVSDAALADDLTAAVRDLSTEVELADDLEARAAAVAADPSPEALTALLSDLPGVDVSRAAVVPLTLAPASAPRRRAPRPLSPQQHHEVVWAAMREATEHPRPEPPESPESRALGDLLRADAVDGHATLHCWFNGRTGRFHGGPHAPASMRTMSPASSATRHAIREAVEALWRVERGAEHGTWLFLRADVRGDDSSLERRYDSWPDWWAFDGFTGPGIDSLRDETEARPADWRPAWAPLLDPEVARTNQTV